MPEKYKKCFRINIKQELNQKTVDNIMLAGVYYIINKRSGNDDDSFYQELTSFFCNGKRSFPLHKNPPGDARCGVKGRCRYATAAGARVCFANSLLLHKNPPGNRTGVEKYISAVL
ncbi:hypothetical protein [Faecalicatena contorta]|uniref:hypothetical protein n=1 Tax=Faecalicatena contorta TaxID=39482 RepID=UPI000D6B2918|nr:hypothetical protein [Faecalicatena contorta]